MCIDEANRLAEVPVKEAIVRSIHQRRATMAAVTDRFWRHPNTHAGMTNLREVSIEPYKPSLEKADAAENAKPNDVWAGMPGTTGDSLTDRATNRQ